MLDTYCNSVSDEAQLKVAIRFGKQAVTVWNNHFKKIPTDIDRVNALITDANRVQGGAAVIDIAFPQRTLEKIERSYGNAKEKNNRSPIPEMKSDPTLTPMLAASMQPLTNKDWDTTLPKTVRLAFTQVFNILMWLLYRRKNDAHETHIYVAINQAVDVILTENLLSKEQIIAILNEYQHEKRSGTEDSEWENAFIVGSTEPLTEEDVYRQIIGEKMNKGGCGLVLAKEVLRQMRDEGKSYWNMMDEYVTGTSTTYSYDKENQTFSRHEIDVIVGSFSNQIPMSEHEMLHYIAKESCGDLRESGFEV